ncbi:adhesive plaque matrix protein-like [Myzus persicae]|uniref:adhesive plaque matrix protein-like n=1 Tax=Myzus persicae TaxID=13164 RepID=UPI000B9310F7|nr:adhesive plaque matrix protein-like [Myzus persicae]
MFKFITLSCLLAVSVQCKVSPNTAVPYYPQPYPAAYPNVYPQFYSAQPKYSVHPAYVAAASYPAAAYPAPASYRQVFVPASPAYNPYYYGYAPYPAPYAQAQQYPYSYVQNDGASGATGASGSEGSGSPGGWGEYLASIWSYVPNFPYGTTGVQPSPAAEGATAGAENQSPGAESPTKGEKPAAAEGPKSGEVASDEQPSQSPTKQFAAYPLPYFGQPQFYGQAPYQQAVYDPAKLNAANNGAVSSFLFPKNIQAVFQHQPQPFADQKYYQAPQANQGTAAQAYQRYLQFQKQHLQGQYQQGQFQQQQQDQPFQQQPEPFQQYDQQPQKDESSVVVDSNVTGLQVNAEGQQQQQSKVATGSN